ncbi:hypothetical protein P5W99_35935 [Paraburkholderia sp. A3BS-1L]|uniref:hypothetical protein n=1 Tax=Paraburkholderia sp. A3BS-1L TaxID=3028375 RepID=UPI003DAA4C56
MSCSKSLFLAVAFGISTGSVLQVAQAATPSMTAALAGTSARLGVAASHAAAAGPVANVTGASGPSGATSSAAPAAPEPGSGVVASAAHDDASLSLRDIDQMARGKVAQYLRGSEAPASAPKAGVSRSTPAPVARQTATFTPTLSQPRAHIQTVTFVGGFSDAMGQHVLYEYKGAVYPARLGEKLLNGAVARKVDRLFVTVSQGGRTWTESMSPGAQESQSTGSTMAGPLADLASPLPPGFAPGAQTIPLGR